MKSQRKTEVKYFRNNNTQLFRSLGMIPGILILANGRSYGKINNKSGTANKPPKLLYECIPHTAANMSRILIPYAFKYKKCTTSATAETENISTLVDNLYILFSVVDNIPVGENTIPRGQIEVVIGSTADNANYYTYLLHCTGLYAKPATHFDFQRVIQDTLWKRHMSSDEQDVRFLSSLYGGQIEDKTGGGGAEESIVLTIDPAGTTCFDDGFSAYLSREGVITVTVYIANVAIWLDALNLWQHMADMPAASLYLPDKVRPMLPEVLSNACSLQQGRVRLAHYMSFDVHVLREGCPENIRFGNVWIRVHKNLSPMDAADNMQDKPIAETLRLAGQAVMCAFATKSFGMPSVSEPKDVVQYLMLLMGAECAAKLAEFPGHVIDRSGCLFLGTAPSVATATATTAEVNDEIQEGLPMLGSIYSSTVIPHAGLRVPAYVHITSPLRRKVDIMNQCAFQYVTGSTQFVNVDAYLDTADATADTAKHITEQTKRIRHTQNKCWFIHVASQALSLNGCDNTEMSGWIVSSSAAVATTTTTPAIKYKVYLPSHKITISAYCDRVLNMYENVTCHVYYFEHRDTFQKKIRAKIV